MVKGGTIAALLLSRDRVLLYGGTLIFIGLSTAFIAPTWHSDWANFWAAGATAGTTDLLDPKRHFAWQIGHHLMPQAFVYPPAVAWFFVPAAHLSIAAGFNLNCLAMLGVCAVCAVIAARAYAIPLAWALLAVFAWVPAVQAGFLGQFTPVALVLALLAILGIARGRPLLSGMAIGLLLYKPQDALVFVVLLAVRSEFRSLRIVFACAIGWYFASVSATAWDWAWPAHYASVLLNYYAADFAPNARKTVSLTGLLLYAGLPVFIAVFAGAALMLSSIPRLARSSRLEAASLAPLLGLACSAHAYMYDAVLVVPAILYAFAKGVEPWRTRLIAVAYALGPSWVLALWVGFDPLAVVVVGGTAIWLLGRFDVTTPAITLQELHSVRRPN